MKGQTVGSGCKLEGAAIIDLAPTLLYLQGVRIPAEMDGRVLLEAFEAEELQTRPPEFGEAHRDATAPLMMKGYSVAEEEKMRERLRNLGYIR
jgi:hypothetical protein